MRKKEVISRVGKVADIMPWIYQMLLPFQMGNNNPLGNTMGHCIGRLVTTSKKLKQEPKHFILCNNGVCISLCWRNYRRCIIFRWKVDRGTKAMKQGKMHQLHGHERNHVHFGFFYIFGLGHFFFREVLVHLFGSSVPWFHFWIVSTCPVYFYFSL